MQTIIHTIDPEHPEKQIHLIQEAAQILRRGGLVAFPTETVYGLGASALSAQAAAGIFAAKGRPGDNPLIVHVSAFEQLAGLVKSITPTAEALARRFWPGPLTIILDKTDAIPPEVSGGLSTVAVRFPAHKVARLLLECAGIPIAAPSANASGRPSPTEARHVAEDMNGRIPMILDGGLSVLGLESTVVDARGPVPVILRPGSITADMLREACGGVSIDPAVYEKPGSSFVPQAPGQKYRHYAPKAKMTLVCGEPSRITSYIQTILAAQPGTTTNTGVLCTDESLPLYPQRTGLTVLSLGSRQDPEEAGARFFRHLRALDASGVSRIYAEGFPTEHDSPWLALMNRMQKAAGYDILWV